MEEKGASSKELFLEYQQTKSPELRSELVLRHMYIAEILSKKYINRGMEADDILQVAYLGLIQAVDRFDPSRGFEFSSFATPTILGEIKKSFRDKGWAVHVPRRIQELTKKVADARAYLQMNKCHNPSTTEIAEYLEVTNQDVVAAIEASYAYSSISLDQRLDADDENDSVLSEVVGREDLRFLEIENRDFLKACIEKLNDTEARVLYLRYHEEKTQSEIAEELNVSQMSISRMEKRIKQKFREELEKL